MNKYYVYANGTWDTTAYVRVTGKKFTAIVIKCRRADFGHSEVLLDYVVIPPTWKEVSRAEALKRL